jgi:hypothetical protein
LGRISAGIVIWWKEPKPRASLIGSSLFFRMATKDSEAKMDDQKLRDIFKFDESDLDANRNGNLSEKQKKNFPPIRAVPS